MRTSVEGLFILTGNQPIAPEDEGEGFLKDPMEYPCNLPDKSADHPIFDGIPPLITLELDASSTLLCIDLCSNPTSSHFL